MALNLKSLHCRVLWGEAVFDIGTNSIALCRVSRPPTNRTAFLSGPLRSSFPVISLGSYVSFNLLSVDPQVSVPMVALS